MRLFRCSAGRSGPDPDIFAEYAVFAERAGLAQFQSKWEAVLVDDWEIARQSKGGRCDVRLSDLRGKESAWPCMTKEKGCWL